MDRHHRHQVVPSKLLFHLENVDIAFSHQFELIGVAVDQVNDVGDGAGPIKGVLLLLNNTRFSAHK